MVDINKVTGSILPHIEHHARQHRVYGRLALPTESILCQKGILTFEIEVDRDGNCGPAKRTPWAKAREKATRFLVNPVTGGIVLDHLQVIVRHGIAFQPDQHAFRKIITIGNPTNSGSPRIPHRSDIAQHGRREFGGGIANVPCTFVKAFLEFGVNTARTIAQRLPRHHDRDRLVHAQGEGIDNLAENAESKTGGYKRNEEQNPQERKPALIERTFSLPPVFRKLDSHFRVR